MEKSFCPLCGNEEKEVLREGFDTKTGKRRTKMACVHIGCEKACEDGTGHTWVNDTFWDSMCNRRKYCKVCNTEVHGGFY